MKKKNKSTSNVVKIAFSVFLLLVSALGLLIISVALSEPVASLLSSLNKAPLQQVTSWFLLILVATPIIAFWLMFFIQFEVAKENIVETLVEKELAVLSKPQLVEQGKMRMSLAQHRRALLVRNRGVPVRKHF